MKRKYIEAWAGSVAGVGAALVLIAFGATLERNGLDPTAGYVIGVILAAFAFGLIVALLARDEEQ